MTSHEAETPNAAPLPSAPGYPVAEVVPAPLAGVPVQLQANQQEKLGEVFTLSGDVRIEYKDYVLTADQVSYDRETGDAEADGHVRLQGGKNNELVLADHGKLNFALETGRFENVTGSVGRLPSSSKRKLVYTTANPFLFTGRLLIKEGPERVPDCAGNDDLLLVAGSGLADSFCADPGELRNGARQKQLLYVAECAHSLPAVCDPTH